ncbi:MAG: hypothetical protein Q8L34_00590 [Candidatus Woesearchaeota archaeon]|nr:hypothetical protein [Candidatus Woesearchaeota archaeon]
MKKDKTKKSLAKKIGIIIGIIVILVIIVALSFKIGCNLVSNIDEEKGEKKEAREIKQQNITDYNRNEDNTYLTFPEWHIVYISEEYADFIEKNNPSGFPYFRTIGQFWKGYCTVYKITSSEYKFNGQYHLMIWVIGVSTSIEYGLKGIYENTIGRITELLSFSQKTEEDQFAYRMNKEYVTFIYDYPWYKFSFWAKEKELWKEVKIFGKKMIRKWERRSILTLELGVKTVYGGIIKFAMGNIYGSDATEIYVTVENIPESLLKKENRIKRITNSSDEEEIVLIPRYRQFTEVVITMAREGVIFKDIAGNQEILITLIAPKEWEYKLSEGKQLFSMQGLNQPEVNRIGVKVPVQKLHKILPELESEHIKIEHIYDY